jgi:hypothetical protein
VRRREHRGAVGPGPHEGRPRGAEPSLDEVIAREDRQHAGRATRRRHIDAHDAGVRVHGADDDRVRLARQAHVLVEASPAPNEAHVLEPLDGLADAELAHHEPQVAAGERRRRTVDGPVIAAILDARACSRA